jgi:hypothetical protein
MKAAHNPSSFSSLSLSPFSLFSSVLLLFLLCGCIGPRLQHGGRAATIGDVSQSLLQSDNPSQPSRQTQDTIRTRTYALPPITPDDPRATHNAIRITQPAATPILLSEQTSTHATTELGAAQKDTSRELAAKLSSLKGIVWVGLGLFVFGLASLFWPPLRAIIGSLTTSAAITLGGIALMILPTLIVGQELYILGAVLVAVGGWFLAHRHGHVRGKLESFSSSSSIRHRKP